MHVVMQRDPSDLRFTKSSAVQSLVFSVSSKYTKMCLRNGTLISGQDFTFRITIILTEFYNDFFLQISERMPAFFGRNQSELFRKIRGQIKIVGPSLASLY